MRPLIDRELTLQDTDIAQVLGALEERFSILIEDGEERVSTYWDTFDWRVWNRDGLLIERPAIPDLRAMVLNPKAKTPNQRELAWYERSGRLRQIAWLSGAESPGMAEDLPEPLVELGPILSMRRLLPKLHLRESGPKLRILDKSEKTVVRLQVLEASAARDAQSPAHGLPARLRIEPIRGYGKEQEKVLRFLRKKFNLEDVEQDLFATGLEAIGRRPGDYSSKIRLKLKRSQSTIEASCTIYRRLFDTMLINEPGMRADTDSEFLHDFRVAVRRTRSALSQIKGVFADDVLGHFKDQFRWLGQITGPTRDLDVYLLKMPAYRADLPEEAQAHLDPLGQFLITRQAEEQKKLVGHLNSARYRDLVEAWRSQLAGPEIGPAAELPVIEVASARIWRLYRRMVKDGRAIDDDTPAAALHEVRIMGKKLRYLMEFFRSLYPKAEVDVAIGELKRLQENLGDFNDYEVQEAAMGHFAEQLSESLKARGEDPAKTLLAMGRLQAHLDDGRRRERYRFGERFERFADDENRHRFKTLFAA